MFDLDKALKSISDNHDKEEWEKFQSEQRSSLRPISELEQKRLHGERSVGIALSRIAELQDGDGVEFEFTRLAEGYALMGDYEKAVEFAPNDEKRRDYQNVLDGLKTTEPCNCPKKKDKVDTEFIKDRFLRKGREVNLWLCTICHRHHA